MDKRVLLIGQTKSFMVNAIAKGLQKENYEVIQCGLSKEEIEGIENKPEIYVLYLGDITEATVDQACLSGMKYIDEDIDKSRFFLYEVGSHDELDFAGKIISGIKVTETYLRPLDVAQLLEDLNIVVESSAEGEEKKKKVLIVDDDGTILRMIRTWLSVKYRVYMASSGKIALNFLESDEVDLVLLDYMMPQMDGPEVLRNIRQNPKTADLPVMFLTSRSDKESVINVASLKPEKYLLKTMPKAKLIRNVDEFFYGPMD